MYFFEFCVRRSCDVTAHGALLLQSAGGLSRARSRLFSQNCLHTTNLTAFFNSCRFCLFKRKTYWTSRPTPVFISHSQHNTTQRGSRVWVRLTRGPRPATLPPTLNPFHPVNTTLNVEDERVERRSMCGVSPEAVCSVTPAGIWTGYVIPGGRENVATEPQLFWKSWKTCLVWTLSFQIQNLKKKKKKSFILQDHHLHEFNKGNILHYCMWFILRLNNSRCYDAD